MASERQARYLERRKSGRGRVVELNAEQAPKCPTPVLLIGRVDRDQTVAKPCESFLCPACGPARRAETVRRVQLGTTVAQQQGREAMTLHLTLHLTLPPELDRMHGYSWRELHQRVMLQLRKLRNRAHARASKFGRPKPQYIFVPEVQPKRGSIAPHLLWFGEPPFPQSMADPRMEVMEGDWSDRARFVRMRTKEGQARSEYLEEIGWGPRYVWEPPQSAHGYVGYLTKYIAKRLALGGEDANSVPVGCCRFTYSRGLIPTRAEWAILRAWNKFKWQMPIGDLCSGKRRVALHVDGELRLIQADRVFWREDWFMDLRRELFDELDFEVNDVEGPVFEFAAQLLSLDEERWRELGVEFGGQWDGEYGSAA